MTRLRKTCLMATAALLGSLWPLAAFAQQYGSNDPTDFDNELRTQQGNPPYIPDNLNEPPQTPVQPPSPPAAPRYVPPNASDFFSSLTNEQQVRFMNWASSQDGQPVTGGYMAALMDMMDAEFERQHLTPEQRSKVLRSIAAEAGVY